MLPRRAGKSKKGLISDASADKLAKVDQNKSPSVFEVPAPVKRCKPEPLTEELKKAKIYLKLRQARTDKRYHGKREARAKNVDNSVKLPKEGEKADE